MNKNFQSGKDLAPIYIDATMLRFTENLRGVPQVLFLMLEILSEPPFRGRTRFLAYQDVAEKHLLPRGILLENITLIPAVPVLGRWERFHGLFSTRRYRRGVEGASFLIHLEARSMTRLDIPQIVLWYDFMQIAGKWKPWKKPSRYLFTYYKYWLAMRRAKGITISEYTRQEALKIFPKTDPGRLTTLWLGTRNQLKPRRPPHPEPLSVPLRCMYLGALEIRKNVFNMLSHLDDIFGSTPFHLDIVGKTSSEEKARAEEALKNSGHRSNITLRGILTDAELLELAECSNVTLFPSLSEGFGLPVAEAMMHGHVVFAFNNTSIPEVGGDAIVLAENNDFQAWGRELQRLLEDPSACTALQYRALERSNIFSEERMKSRYREYFQDLIVHIEGS